MIIPLKERLKKAASLVGFESFDCTAPGNILRRCGKRIFVSDVGCDHAYLSLFLVLNGIADGAIASDVRKGPLEAAKQNIERFSCGDRIQTLLTDGLQGIDSFDPTDIVICGMGGETIMSILNEAPFVKENGRRLILQPQSAIAEVYLYLLANGFRIYAERFAFDDNKPYRIIAAVYDGLVRSDALINAMKGTLYYPEDKEAYLAFCQKTAAAIEKKANGVRMRGGDAYELDALREALLQS